MPAPLLMAGVGVLGGLVGDLFGSDGQADEYRKEADAALLREKGLLRDRDQVFRNAQVQKGQIALAQAQAMRRALQDPSLLGGDIISRPKIKF